MERIQLFILYGAVDVYGNQFCEEERLFHGCLFRECIKKGGHYS